MHNGKGLVLLMKRCPQCSFLYLDSDQLCDLDHTPLIADESGSDLDAIDLPEPKTYKLSLTAAFRERKLNLKTLSAATAAGLIIGLMLLIGYQKIRTTVQASRPPAASQAPKSQDYRAPAADLTNEVIAKAPLAQQESTTLASLHSTTPPAKPMSPAKTLFTRVESARPRLTSDPVSTGEVAGPARPVTIRLTNGSSLEADEVWRTRAGVWYRRKGMVTFLKTKRLRAISK